MLMRMPWLVLGIALAAAPLAHAVTDDERLQAYREFRTAFDSKQYQDAVPLAERVVALTEEQYGDKARELVNPLTNLGTVHHRLGNHKAAEPAYLRSVEILEAVSATDRLLLRPLQGLGETYNSLEQYDDARLVLKRAVDLSRNLDGLYNLEQLVIVEPLIQSYVALGQEADAEKESQYAFRVAETAFGRTDARMLGPIDRYARWFESVGRYTTARALHGRALAIAENQGKNTPRSVNALRGIARCYRLEFINGPEDASRQEIGNGFQNTNAMASADMGLGQRMNADGERALKMALVALETEQPTPHTKRGETLTELGDWYLSAGETEKALQVYREAWKDLLAGGSTELLSAPRQLAYRPPSSSVTRSRIDPDDAEERYVEVRFTVTRDGQTENVVAAESDAPTAVQKSVVNAVKKARYSPRLENGEAVDAEGVIYRERVVIKRPKDA